MKRNNAPWQASPQSAGRTHFTATISAGGRLNGVDREARCLREAVAEGRI